MLTGEPGTGKSTLLNALAETFGGNVRCAKVSDPAIGEMDFFNFIADAFEMGRSFKSKADFLIHLQRFLDEAAAGPRKSVLVIDEAQRISDALLDQIRVLAKLDGGGGKGLSCVFAGQEEFLPILGRNRALSQRVFFSHVIKPLTAGRNRALHRPPAAGGRRAAADLHGSGREAGVPLVQGQPAADQHHLRPVPADRLLGRAGDDRPRGGRREHRQHPDPASFPRKRSRGATAEPPAPEPEAPAAGATAAPRRAGVQGGLLGAGGRGLLLGRLGGLLVHGRSRARSRGLRTGPGRRPEAELRRLQDQLTDLARQKADAEERVKGYEAKLESLEKGQQEADTPRVRASPSSNPAWPRAPRT